MAKRGQEKEKGYKKKKNKRARMKLTREKGQGNGDLRSEVFERNRDRFSRRRRSERVSCVGTTTCKRGEVGKVMMVRVTGSRRRIIMPRMLNWAKEE